MCQPYIENATTLSDYYYIDNEEPQEFLFLSRGRIGLPALSRTHKCECSFEIRCSVLVNVSVRHTRFIWRSNSLNIVLVGGTACCNPT